MRVSSTLLQELNFRLWYETYSNTYYDVFLDQFETVSTFSIYETQRIMSDFFACSNYEDIQKKLYEAQVLYQAYKGKRHPIEKAFAFLRYVEQYRECILHLKKTMELVKPTSKWLLDFYQQILQIDQKMQQAALEESYPKMYSLSKHIRTFSYVKEDKNQYITLQPVHTVKEAFSNIRNKMGLDSSNPTLRYRKKQNFSSLDILEQVFKEEVSALISFEQQNAFLLENTMEKEEKMMEYFLAWKQFFHTLAQKNIPYCKATITKENTLSLIGLYNMEVLLHQDSIVPNDLFFPTGEWLKMITGANGGGKTTYVRGILWNLVLYQLTGYVLANSATLPVILQLFAHFPNEERYIAGEGRLENEKNRIKAMLATLQTGSFVVFNETFSSTNDHQGRIEFEKVIKQCNQHGAYVVFVTHNVEIIEKAKEYRGRIYIPLLRQEEVKKHTFKIVEAENASVYVDEILEKYSLTTDALKRRGTKQ